MITKHKLLLALAYVVTVILIFIALVLFFYWRHLIAAGYDKVDMREVYRAYAGDYLE